MKWTVHSPRSSALSGVTGDQSLYRVHLLDVSESDELSTACVEFWQRILTVGREKCSNRWQILLFESWTDAGLISAVFTTPDRMFDEPEEFKLTSPVLLQEYAALPDVTIDWQRFMTEHSAVERRYRDLLTVAASTDSVARLLADWRAAKPMAVWSTYCNDMERATQLQV